MLTLKEIVESEELKLAKQVMDEKKQYISPFDYALPDKRREIRETLRKVSLRELVNWTKSKETLVSGQAGASYLIPEKLYSILLDAAGPVDLSNQICADVFTDIPGSAVKVQKEKAGQYKASWLAEFGGRPHETAEFEQVIITPKEFGININISKSMIEDSEWDLVEWHVRRAGEQMGRFLTDHILSILVAASGANALTTAASGVLDIADLIAAYAKVLPNDYIPNTIVIYPTSLTDVIKDTTNYNLSIEFRQTLLTQGAYPRILGCDLIVHTSSSLAQSSSDRYYGLMFDKKAACILAKKRPITIENYSDPVNGLVGAMVSSRAAAGVVFAKSLCVITEKA